MHLTRALTVGFAALALLSTPAVPADQPAGGAGTEAPDGQKIGEFASEYSEVVYAMTFCEFQPQGANLAAWVDENFKQNAYDRDFITSLMLTFVYAGMAADSQFDEDKPVESCKAFGDKYGPSGTVRKGILTGSGKPRT